QAFCLGSRATICLPREPCFPSRESLMPSLAFTPSMRSRSPSRRCWRSEGFPYTHDLDGLLELCQENDIDVPETLSEVDRFRPTESSGVTARAHRVASLAIGRCAGRTPQSSGRRGSSSRLPTGQLDSDSLTFVMANARVTRSTSSGRALAGMERSVVVIRVCPRKSCTNRASACRATRLPAAWRSAWNRKGRNPGGVAGGLETTPSGRRIESAPEPRAEDVVVASGVVAARL